MVEITADKTAPEVQSMSKGERTRARILDLAYDSIIEKGFVATSIDELVTAAEITKSGFFYHFRDKNDLARQLLKRYLEENETILDELEARARDLHEDPLHAFLIFLKFYAEMMEQLLEQHPGCLVASITYQDRSFDPEVRAMNEEGIEAWRRRYRSWFEEIMKVHPPRLPVSAADLADQICVVADGALIVAKGVRNHQLVGRQAILYRDMIRALFDA